MLPAHLIPSQSNITYYDYVDTDDNVLEQQFHPNETTTKLVDSNPSSEYDTDTEDNIPLTVLFRRGQTDTEDDTDTENMSPLSHSPHIIYSTTPRASKTHTHTPPTPLGKTYIIQTSSPTPLDLLYPPQHTAASHRTIGSTGART
jgi:hypothetical protein